MALIYYYMFTSFTGYADDIFHVISNFHITRSNFGVYPKNCWTRFCQLQEPLILGGARATPSVKGSGGQDCRGKQRAEALLNPDVSVQLLN